MDRVREKARTAKLLIADLTGANPNVYLEVGYTWGCGVPTILIVRYTNNWEKHLEFDVRDQRCLPYKKIKDLQELLTKEALRAF